MYSNSLKTILVLVTELQVEYQNVLCKGISERARELGYNVVFLCWDNPYGQHKNYVKGESNIFNLLDYSEVDGIVYLKDVFSDESVEKMVEQKISVTDVPKVAVRCRIDGFYNVIVDNASGISAILKHFILEHKCTRIAFMSGKREMADSKLRLAAYEEIMKEYGLEYDDSYIFHGNYWKDKAVEACDQFLGSPLGEPEAIVCANDYMAISVMDELIKRGYRVPEDIMVSGFDNISETYDNVKSLTTVDIPVRKMAYGAVDIIDNVINKREQAQNLLVKTEPVYRNSSRCKNRNRGEHTVMRRQGELDYFEYYDASRTLRYMSVALEGASNLEELSAVVDRFMYVHDNYKNFFMCLTKADRKSGLDVISSVIDGYSDDSLCALAIIDRGHTGDYPLAFRTSELIPPIYVSEEPQIYYFMPLHFLDINYGYVAINYYDYGQMTDTLNTFITHISSSIDNIHNKMKLQKTLSDLELLYITDPLTNLYNRRGFEVNAAEVFENCRKNNLPAMVMTLDMDDMKSINDNFGHMQGDIALKMLGKALSYAVTGKEICARVGGDEFNVIAGDYTAEECDRFIRNVLEYMDGYNEVNSMPFGIEISYGSVLIDDFEAGNLEYFMNISDNRMYKQKFKKKKRRGMSSDYPAE